MDELKNGVIEEYASSLGDLSFNSKPLINVLTMLAEENVQFASSITKLISDRVLRVRAEWKLPSLYLLDSIVKNIGGDYLQAVAEVIRSVFVSVFEKGDEKVRRDLFKLRNTWPSYFSVNVLYDIDMHVNKVDPNWPITAVPPPSPTIHINPKFLKKAEEESANKELENIKSIKETAVMDEYQNKHLQLQALQDEQMKLHSCELEELRLKQELLMKKQQKERLLLVKQQQQQILKLRLQGEEDADFASSNGPSTPPNLERTQPVAPGPLKKNIPRDPRLRKVEDRNQGSPKIEENSEQVDERIVQLKNESVFSRLSPRHEEDNPPLQPQPITQRGNQREFPDKRQQNAVDRQQKNSEGSSKHQSIKKEEDKTNRNEKYHSKPPTRDNSRNKNDRGDSIPEKNKPDQGNHRGGSRDTGNKSIRDDQGTERVILRGGGAKMSRKHSKKDDDNNKRQNTEDDDVSSGVGRGKFKKGRGGHGPARGEEDRKHMKSNNDKNTSKHANKAPFRDTEQGNGRGRHSHRGRQSDKAGAGPEQDEKKFAGLRTREGEVLPLDKILDKTDSHKKPLTRHAGEPDRHSPVGDDRPPFMGGSREQGRPEDRHHEGRPNDRHHFPGRSDDRFIGQGSHGPVDRPPHGDPGRPDDRSLGPGRPGPDQFGPNGRHFPHRGPGRPDDRHHKPDRERPDVPVGQERPHMRESVRPGERLLNHDRPPSSSPRQDDFVIVGPRPDISRPDRHPNERHMGLVRPRLEPGDRHFDHQGQVRPNEGHLVHRPGFDFIPDVRPMIPGERNHGPPVSRPDVRAPGRPEDRHLPPDRIPFHDPGIPSDGSPKPESPKMLEGRPPIAKPAPPGRPREMIVPGGRMLLEEPPHKMAKLTPPHEADPGIPKPLFSHTEIQAIRGQREKADDHKEMVLRVDHPRRPEDGIMHPDEHRAGLLRGPHGLVKGPVVEMMQIDDVRHGSPRGQESELLHPDNIRHGPPRGLEMEHLHPDDLRQGPPRGQEMKMIHPDDVRQGPPRGPEMEHLHPSDLRHGPQRGSGMLMNYPDDIRPRGLEMERMHPDNLRHGPPRGLEMEHLHPENLRHGPPRGSEMERLHPNELRHGPPGIPMNHPDDIIRPGPPRGLEMEHMHPDNVRHGSPRRPEIEHLHSDELRPHHDELRPHPGLLRGPPMDQRFAGNPMHRERFPHPGDRFGDHRGPMHGPSDRLRPIDRPVLVDRPAYGGDVQIPRELTLEHKDEIIQRAERRLSTGQLSEKQHEELMIKLDQLFKLQKDQLDDVQHEVQHPHFLPHPEAQRPPFNPQMGHDVIPMGHGDGPRMMEPHRPGFHGPGPDGPQMPWPHGHPGSDMHPNHHGPRHNHGPMGPEEHMFRPEFRPIRHPGQGGPREGLRHEPGVHGQGLIHGPMHGPGSAGHGTIHRPEGPDHGPIHGPGGHGLIQGPGGLMLEPGHRLMMEQGLMIEPGHPPVVDQGQRGPMFPEQGKVPVSRPDMGPVMELVSQPPVSSAAQNPAMGPQNPAVGPQNPAMGPQSVNDLFNRLVDFGIIKVMLDEETQSRADTPTQMQQEDTIEEIPEVKLVPTDLRKFHPGVVQIMYAGKQCSSCGVRFVGDCNDIYQDHLDWHFRMNRKEKDSKRATHRQWYFSQDDWSSYEEVADLDERAKSSFFEMDVTNEVEPEIVVGDGSCPVDTSIENDGFCDICCDQFEQFWNEAEEEWHYKEAIRVNGKTLHAVCYQDAKEDPTEVEIDTEDSDDPSQSEIDPTSSEPGADSTQPLDSTQPVDEKMDISEVKIKEEPVDEDTQLAGQEGNQVDSSVAKSDLSSINNDVVKEDENKEIKIEVTSSDDVQIKQENNVDETGS